MTIIPSRLIRVLAFDPGITQMGWSALSYNCADDTTTVTRHGLITGQRLLKERKELQNKFSKPFIILEVYYEIFCRLIEETNPDAVVTEGAFYHRFPQTFASLTLVIFTLRRACRDKLGRDLYEIAPKETKKLVTGSGDKTEKLQIKEALLRRPNLIIRDSKQAPLEEISEHEYDAIAHGLTFITNELPAFLAYYPMS